MSQERLKQRQASAYFNACRIINLNLLCELFVQLCKLVVLLGIDLTVVYYV